ncbi:hypothetical protein HAX54_028653, partial [Datura stramonium]|nr:hypothetical protein [Datura stramonium]
MITLDEEYYMRGTIMPVGSTKAVVATSSVAHFIMVQLRTPRFVVTTIISKKLEYNSKAVPWDYLAEAKTKIINTATDHGMTRPGRCYVPDNLNKPAPGREHNQKRNVTEAEVAG